MFTMVDSMKLLRRLQRHNVAIHSVYTVQQQLFGSGTGYVELLNRSGSNIFAYFQVLSNQYIISKLSAMTDDKCVSRQATLSTKRFQSSSRSSMTLQVFHKKPGDRLRLLGLALVGVLSEQRISYPRLRSLLSLATGNGWYKRGRLKDASPVFPHGPWRRGQSRSRARERRPRYELCRVMKPQVERISSTDYSSSKERR